MAQPDPQAPKVMWAHPAQSVQQVLLERMQRHAKRPTMGMAVSRSPAPEVNPSRFGMDVMGQMAVTEPMDRMGTMVETAMMHHRVL